MMWYLCSEWHLQQYDGHLGNVDWKDKITLDIGADYGTTVDYFLNKGAKKVYAIEGSDLFFELLNSHILSFFKDNAICEKIFINKPEDFIYLLTKYRDADIVKVDVEGAEIHLADVPDEIFRIIPEYVLEYHSQECKEKLEKKLEKNNYIFYNNSVDCFVLYARRKDE